MVEKSAADFNRDHVIPEAFGLFEGTFVLACVCTACNQFFGDTVELKLARDSIEAHDRVRVGLKDARQFQALGKRSTTYVEFGTDSPAPGAHGYLVPPKEGPDLAVTVKPRVGFGHSADGPFDWRPIDQLPTKDELAALGFRKGEPLYMQTQGEAPIEEFQSALATKGIPFSVTSEVPPPAGAAHVEVVYTLARPEFRALTKIALNYLAAVAGSDVAREPWFHQARRFARYDEGKNPVKPPLARLFEPSPHHYVSVQSVAGGVVAHVSLLMRCRYYAIVLAREGVAPDLISSAHLFNLDTREVTATLPMPLT